MSASWTSGPSSGSVSRSSASGTASPRRRALPGSAAASRPATKACDTSMSRAACIETIATLLGSPAGTTSSSGIPASATAVR